MQGKTKAITAVGLIVLVTVMIGLIANHTLPLTSTSFSFCQTTSVCVLTTQTTLVPMQILSASSTILNPGYYVDVSVRLTKGSSLQVSWDASGAANVYVFSSLEWSKYTLQEVPISNIASELYIASGIIQVRIPYDDTYHVVLENPHTGMFGYNGSNIELYHIVVVGALAETSNTH